MLLDRWNQLRDRFLDWAPVAAFIRWLKVTSLPGFDGIPIYDVGKFFWQETQRDRLTVRSSSMAFNFMLATFPGILFLFTLIPYIPVEGLNENLMNLLSDLMPNEAFAFIRRAVTDIINTQRLDLLSFGFVLAFYFATNGVTSMMAAFDKRQPTFRRRSWWQFRGAAIRLTVYLLVLFIGSLVLIIGGSQIMQWGEGRYGLDRHLLNVMGDVMRWTIIVGLYFFLISFIYHYGPNVKQRWKFISPGGTLATLLSICATLGFAYFVRRFGVYNEIYGSLGALIVFMIWLNLNTFVILVGFELNNSIDINKHLRMQREEEAESV